MSLAQDLYEQAFSSPRTPRSPSYHMGVKDALTRIFEGGCIHIPFEAGSPEFDACVAGRQEGHQIAAEYMQQCVAPDAVNGCKAALATYVRGQK
jgi:hypothetical protein